MGVRTRANRPQGSADNFWRIGIANATVFPDPVLAFPMQSLPYMQASIKDMFISEVQWELAMKKGRYARCLHFRRSANRHA